MSRRISDARLAELRGWESPGYSPVGKDLVNALTELEQSRALITQLRELAERMRVSWAEQSQSESQYASGHSEANGEWLDEIDSLLSALGSAQADAQGKR